MIEYELIYSPGSRPQVSKKFTASSGEVFSVAISFESEEDREALSSEQIYQHLENLLSYIKDKAQDLSVVHEDDEPSNDGWHIKGGWGEMTWANDESLKWWEYVYYREEYDEPVVEEPQPEGDSGV